MAFGLTNKATCPLTGAGLVRKSMKVNDRDASVAVAPDEWGQAIKRKAYGADPTILDCEAELTLESGTSPATVTLGASTMIVSLKIDTSNSDWPKYTIHWKEGLKNVSGLSFTVALPTVKPWRCAQKLDGLEVTGGKLSSCSVNYTCDFAETDGEEGEQGACSFTNGLAELTAEAVAPDETPVVYTAAGWEIESDGAGVNSGNVAYETASSFKASKALAATLPTDPVV